MLEYIYPWFELYSLAFIFKEDIKKMIFSLALNRKTLNFLGSKLLHSVIKLFAWWIFYQCHWQRDWFMELSPSSLVQRSSSIYFHQPLPIDDSVEISIQFILFDRNRNGSTRKDNLIDRVASITAKLNIWDQGWSIFSGFC